MRLQDIKGLGVSRIKKLNEAGIYSPLDLCCRFPHKYIDASAVNRFDEAGSEVVGFGKMVGLENRRIRKNLSYIKIEFEAADGKKFWATWFNQPFISRAVKPDTLYYIIGKLAFKAGRVEITAPVLRTAEKGGGIIPVYRGTGLSSALFSDAVKTVLESTGLISFLPEAVREIAGLMDTAEAFKKAHFPLSLEDAAHARRSLSLENLALHIALYLHTKSLNTTQKPHDYNKANSENSTLNLPFELTADQTNAYKKIVEFLREPQPANILIEGDVGSGKTAVCMLAMNFAAQNGHQSVLMSPTELLARQHYATACKLFAQGEVEFLSGSQTAAERRNSLFNIKYGEAKVIVGTHSVFTKDVEYRDLSLVITDEQHRFGVGQRGALENKSISPDRIVLSATPIPRTLALTLYGDLQLITLRQKPQKKAEVFTRFVGEKIPEMYNYIMDKAAEGEQAYIVCPRIDGDEDEGITGAEELFSKLKTKFGDKIGLLHGRMKEAQKNAVMNGFINGAIKVLVATTIVEVGIDVPAATTMVIYNAERFGLSQLHQLRGRIGRGGKSGYCFLICQNEAAADRLKILTECSDGFALAEKDFELRGAGDFLGTRQHGDSLTFTGEPITAELLKKAKEIALLLKDEDLSGILSSESQLYFKELALN